MMGVSARTRHGLVTDVTYQCDAKSSPNCRHLEDFYGPIVTATIQYQVLKVRILLLEHAENRLLDELTLVVRRCDNRKSWIRHRSL